MIRTSTPRPRVLGLAITHELDLRAVGALEQLVLVPGVRVWSDEGTWHVEVPRTLHGADVWTQFVDAIDPAGAASLRAQLEAMQAAPRRAWPATRVFEALYPHQREAVRFLLERRHAILADDMGLGKTRSAAVAAATLAAPGRGKVLIVGPKFTRATWRQELREAGLTTSDEAFLAVEGRETPDGFWERAAAATFWFVHADLVDAWMPRLLVNSAGRPQVAIVDEAHWYRNAKAARSKALLGHLGTIPHRILLTGTPVANRPRELWSLLTLADGPGQWGSEFDFRTRYCGAYNDGYGLKDGGPTNTLELQQRLQNSYLRRTAEDSGIELPELRRRTYDVEGFPDFAHRDDDALARVARALERGTYSTDTLRVMSALARETSRVKVPATVALAQELLEVGEPFVIFVHERARADELARKIGIDVVSVHGEHAQEVRDQVVRDFQAGRHAGIVATYGALREGVTLHRARQVILHDLTWVPGDVLQAEKRVHRIGQRRWVQSTWMLLPRSFDTLLACHLVQKGRAIAASVNDRKAEDAFTGAGLARFAGMSVEEELERFLAEVS